MGTIKEDIAICKKRYSEDRLLDVTKRPECLDAMTDGGFWNDLVYDGKTVSCAFRHPTRLLEIAKAVYNPESELYRDKYATSRLEAGINFWLEKNIRFTDNWWYNSIGVPSSFADLMLAAGDMLAPETERAAFEYLKNKIEENERTAKNSTGTNIYSRERIRLGYSLYAEDIERLRDVFDIVSSSIKMVTKESAESDYKKRIWESYVKLDHLPDTMEGMQVDYSFLQHGPLLLSGSYGKELICILSSFLSYANGTSLISPDSVADFSDMLLEHYRWLFRRNTIDYTVMGRSISRNSFASRSKNAFPIYSALKLLSEIESLPRHDEIKEFYDNVTNGLPPVLGTRHFWKSDYTSMQRENFLITVRASSNRTIASEQVNTENLLCDYLGDGVTYIYRDGEEYNSIFPVWDWHKVPGTTSLLKEFSPPMVQHRAVRGSESDDVGGVSDGSYGVSAMQLVRDGLSARKAWFMFDTELVALGTDIKNDTGMPHISTVNQSLLRSEVSIFEGSAVKSLENGAEHIASPMWVHHDKTGYFFPKGTKAKIGVEPGKAGDWTRISWNGAYQQPARLEPASADAFTLWFDHAENESDSYEYIVKPEIELSSMALENPYSYIRVISNTPTLQAVENTRLKAVQGVFWHENALLKTESGLELTADKKVLVELRECSGELVLAVASLSAKSEELLLCVNKALVGDGVTENNGNSKIKISLPDGEYRGSSVVLKLKIKD